METLESIIKPTKDEQVTAKKSYAQLAEVLSKVKNLDQEIEIEIEETQEKIKIPISALKLLAKVLKELSNGNPVSIVPIATELTTQAAAEILGCSRPHIIKLLEEGVIKFTKVGKHRRIKYEDVLKYKAEYKDKQEKALIDLMKMDEDSGLYDL